MSSSLYWYNFNEARELMDIAKDQFIKAAVYINGTLVADGTGFSGPLINDEKFDACLTAFRYIESVLPTENITVEEMCVYNQLGYPEELKKYENISMG